MPTAGGHGRGVGVLMGVGMSLGPGTVGGAPAVSNCCGVVGTHGRPDVYTASGEPVACLFVVMQAVIVLVIDSWGSELRVCWAVELLPHTVGR